MDHHHQLILEQGKYYFPLLPFFENRNEFLQIPLYGVLMIGHGI